MLKILQRFKTIHSTTIFAIKKNGATIMIGDGQVTQGDTLIKHDAKKIREIKPGVICGFAGSLADCLTLIEHLEKFINKFPKHRLLKPCIELAIKWRTDSYFKRLEASVLVADKNELIEIDGQGNVLVHDRFRAIGSGGHYAECAAEALYEFQDQDAISIAKRSMEIASLKCIYTNNNFIIKSLNQNDK